MRRLLVLVLLFGSLAISPPAGAEESAATPTALDCALNGTHMTNFTQLGLNAQAACAGVNRGAAGAFAGSVGWYGPMRHPIGTCFDAESAGPSIFHSTFGWNGTVMWTWVGLTMVARGTATDGAGRTVDINAVVELVPANPTTLIQCVPGTPPTMTYLLQGTLTITDHASNT
jgi:hypothetical protein